MKKIIILLALCLASVSAFAQPRAIGIRFGGDAGISYQHYVNGDNWIEADFGTIHWNGCGLTGIYDFNIFQDCFSISGMNFYAGPAVQIRYVARGDSKFDFGIGGQVGFEYCFPAIPLNLSIDYRPVWNFIGSYGNWGSIAVGARYAF